MFSELDMYCTDPAQHLITAAQHLDALVQVGDVDRDLSDFWTLSSLVRALGSLVQTLHESQQIGRRRVSWHYCSRSSFLAIPCYHR